MPDERVATAVPARWREDLLARILRERLLPNDQPSRVHLLVRLRGRILVGSGARRVRVRTALAFAAILLAAGGAGALAAPGVRESLADLGAWLREIPGELSPEHQARFEEQNAASYGRFPRGTRVGLLVRQSVGEQTFELLGFRAGDRLCLRLETSALPAATRPPECVPLWELRRTDQSAAVLAAHLFAHVSDGSSRPVVYGIVADDVRRLEVDVGGIGGGEAAIAHNAFLYIGGPAETTGPGVRSVTTVAVSESGRRSEIRVAWNPLMVEGGGAQLPGPDGVERTLEDGRVDWLDRGDPRGEEFAWPEQRRLRVVHARSIQPDPASPFRIAISRAESVGASPGTTFYCLKWLWPLTATTGSTSCIRADSVASGVAYTADLPNSGEQFPLWAGLVADEIERLQLFYSDGLSRAIPIVENTFAFQTRRGEPVKLVAYDHAGDVVKVGLVGSAESGLSGFSMSP